MEIKLKNKFNVMFYIVIAAFLQYFSLTVEFVFVIFNIDIVE